MNLRINWIMAAANMSGGTKSNRLIAEAMQRRGHDVVMYYPKRARRWPSILSPRQFMRRVKLELAIARRQSHQLEDAAIPMVALYGSRVTVDDVRDADVSIATWWATREWIETWPPSKGIKAYFVRHHELHGGDPERVAATYRLPGTKLVIAKWLKKLMETEYADPDSVLVPNGVIRSQFDSEPRDKQPVPTVGVVYARQEWKAADYAVRSLALAQREMPELHVTMFGSIPMPKWVAKSLKNLTYEVRPAPSRIADIYRGADMWLLPSDTEGFGMPGVEAAACHCPIIATRCGGPEDYIDDGRSGYLVDVRDKQAMADAIVRVGRKSNEEWRRMSAASYEMSLRFDWDESAKLLEAALIEAVARDASPCVPSEVGGAA